MPKKHTITLEPVTVVDTITSTMRGDLAAIGTRDAYLVADAVDVFRSRNGRISAGIDSMPPTATTRLIDRGLVTLGDPYKLTSNGYLPETRTPVRVSLAARLAMLAQDHRTHTIAPAVETVARNPQDKGFVPQPKRWRVEQTYGILILHRRLVRDYEHRPSFSASRVCWAMTHVMVRRLTGANTPTWRDPQTVSA